MSDLVKGKPTPPVVTTLGSDRLMPEWRADFEAETLALTVDRAVKVTWMGLLVNLPLFMLVDYRKFISGTWGENPATGRICVWRIAFSLVCVAYLLAHHWLQGRSNKSLANTIVCIILMAGIWFSVVCQTLIADFSIYALGLFLVATLFPLSTPLKYYLIPLSLPPLLLGSWIVAKTQFEEGNGIVDPAVVMIVAVIVEHICRKAYIQSYVKGRIIHEERKRSDVLLRNVLPDSIAEKLKGSSPGTIVEFHGDISILFADFVGFTQMTKRLSAGDLIALLDRLFLAFDEAAERHQIEKIKTIGDSYMAACGVPLSVTDHAERIARLALDMLEITRRFNVDPDLPINIRIGFHTGPAIAGVIGRKKFCYDLWGDTVNTASRLEAHGEAGRIHVGEQVYHHLKSIYRFEPRGTIPIKGQGELRTYFLCPPA